MFVSDQSVILARHSNFRFMVKVEGRSGQVLHVPLHWSSPDPSQVAVTSDGTATAMAYAGSVDISVSAQGAKAQTAQVTMASPAPGTLIMPSTEIMAKTSTSVTLRRTPQTAAIKRGQILVGDGRSGLLARVTKITVDTAKVTIFTVSASLASAFTGLSIETESVPISISMSPNAHNPADCKLPSGREADMKLAGSSVSVRGTRATRGRPSDQP